MVERYYDPQFKGKFEGVGKFLYEVISKYKKFLLDNEIPHTREDLVRCMNFLMCGVKDRFNTDTTLYLILRFENGDDVLSTKITKGLGKHDATEIYLDEEHVDDLYESQISECEDYEEKGDWEGTIDDKWIRYLYVPVSKTSKLEEQPEQKSSLDEIMKNLRALRDPKN